MKIRILLTILLSIVVTSPFFAQKSNIFLDRNYWKSNPSIENIKQKITEGNDVSELDRFAFDAVSWAFIEKVDNKAIKFLLSQDGNGVNKLTHDGRSYIFWAAYKDNLEMMSYLLNKGAKTDIIDSHGYSVLNFAAVTGQTNTKVYDFLINRGANPSIEKNHDGANALLLVAPFLTDGEIVDYFSKHNVSLKSTDASGNGILAYAARGGNKEFLNWLINKNVVMDKNTMIFTSQGTRGKKNTLDIYKFLENKGIEVNVVDDQGRNPLHSVAYSVEDLEILKYFVDRDVNVNQEDESGRTPFMNAANRNSLDVVSFLAGYVNDVNLADNKGRTALAMAVNRNDISIIEYLIEKGADVKAVDKEGNNLGYYLLDTFNAQKTEVFTNKLNLLKEHGLDITETQGKGKTLFHLAIERNNLELLKHLQKFDIDINAKNDDGLTALHFAAMKAKSEDMLKYLISRGADKTAKTDFDESVYELAKENELLQSNNVNINFLK